MSRRIFTFSLLALTFYICLPLLLPVAMGAVFAVLLYPILIRLERRKFSTGHAAAILSIGISLLVLIPSVVLIIQGAKAGIEELHFLKDAPRGSGSSPFESLLQVPVFQRLAQYANDTFKVETAEIVIALEDGAKSLALRMADILGGFLSQIPAYVMGLLVTVVSVYFFLVDARGLADFVRRNSFFDPEQTEALILAFSGTCRSVILATVVSGLAQAALYSIACLIVGRANIVLTGFTVFAFSFVPLIGSAPVTLGIGLHQLLTGSSRIGGIFLLIVAGLVAVVDNFIRPAILRGSANLHPLLAFLAVFGGLQTFGFAGVFLGPIIAALAVASIQYLTRPRAVAIVGVGTDSGS